MIVIFAVGVAVGQVLDDSSPPAGTNTSVRTLEPGTLSAETVTVTVETTPLSFRITIIRNTHF